PIPGYTGSELSPSDIISTRDAYPPSMGSVCEWLRQQGPAPRSGRGVRLPDYVYLPCYLGWGQAIRRPGPYAGFLGKQYDPFCTEVTPSLDRGCACLPGQPQIVRGQPRLPEGSATAGLTLDRLNRRAGLLRQFDSGRRGLDAGPAPAAFDLGREPPAVRDAYGWTLFGSSTLMARRLIEAGCRFVNVTWDIFWDRFKID